MIPFRHLKLSLPLLALLAANSELLWAMGPPSGPEEVECSPLVASEQIAVINELAFDGNTTNIEFIELKILDTSLDPIDISGWTLSFSKNEQTPVSVTLGTGAGTWNTTGRNDDDGPDASNPTQFPANTWLIYPFASLVAGQGEVLLLDPDGKTIDYVRYYNNNDNRQFWDIPSECGGDNVIERGNAGDKDFARIPDGTGDWGNNGDDPTPGESNDDDPAGPDHYAINYADTTLNGIACEAVTITFTAHDSDHNAIDAEQAAATLTTSSNRGGWSGTGITDSNTSDGSATLQFGLGATAATVALSYPDLGGAGTDTFTITIDDGTVSNTGGSAVAGDSLAVTLVEAGFRFINESGGSTSTTLPTQVAGVDSANDEIILQAIRTDSQTGECTGVYGLGDTISVGLAAEAIDPVAEAGINPTINSSGIPIHNNNSGLGVSGGYTDVDLTFGADSKTALTVNYGDVGQIQLHAQDLVTLPAGVDVTLEGSSSGFVVIPYRFEVVLVESNDVSPIPNPGTTTTNDSGNGFLPAGTQFRMVVEAQNASGDLTPNYGNETTPENIEIVFTELAFPSVAGGSNGLLSNPREFSSTANAGEFENTILSWNEAGTFTATANVARTDTEVANDITDGSYTPGNYLGSDTDGVAFPLVSGNIGRFYPAYFDLDNSQDANTASHSCEPINSNFSYLSEPDLALKFAISARSINGALLTNYDNTDLNYVNNSLPTEADNIGQVTFHAENNNDGIDLNSPTERFQLNNTPTWDGGRYLVDTANSTLAQFNRDGGLEAPLTALQLSVSVTDADHAIDNNFATLSSAALNQNPTGTLDCLSQSPSTCTTAAIGYNNSNSSFNTLELRYGRLIANDAYGPESSPLPVIFGTEYWDGVAFITAADDNCTTLTYNQVEFDNNAVTTHPQTVNFTGGTTIGTFGNNGTEFLTTGGTFNLVFSAPGAGNTGNFPLNVNLLNYPWLRYDWNQDGNDTDLLLPEATISFGSFRGHDRVIYWRERFD